MPSFLRYFLNLLIVYYKSLNYDIIKSNFLGIKILKKYVILSLALLISCPAFAGSVPVELGEYGDWTAYSYKEENPPAPPPAPPPIFVFFYNVVNFVAGYDYKKGSGVVVKIGTTSFNNLFTSGDNAWAPDASTDKKLVDAMKRGQRMIVEGMSSRGTKTKDTYSLAGFTGAYKAISAKCK